MLLDQKNKCKCCGIDFDTQPSKSICVDHCHNTGKIRGIICRRCNTALGFLFDNPEYVKKLYLYSTNNPS